MWYNDKKDIKTLTQKYMATRTAKTKQTAKKAAPPANLYRLLTATPIFDEERQQFWLERYEHLPIAAQHELAQHLADAAEEIAREEDAHESRMAEIHGKYETKINAIAKKHQLHKVEILSPKKEQEIADDLINEELFAQLEMYDSN